MNSGVSSSGSAMIPATDSTLSAAALSDFMASAYLLGEIARIRLHAKGVNDTYFVETTGGRRFFLRVYRRNWRTVSQVESEISILLHLSASGVGVAAPVARRNGVFLSILKCCEGERPAVLFECAAGDLVDYNSYSIEDGKLYASGIADIHSAMDSYGGKADRPALCTGEILEKPASVLINALDRRPSDKRLVEDVTTWLRSSIANAGCLKIGFCHGDLHGQNACLANKRFTYFDFDFCGWGYRAYELSVFPWVFLYRREEETKVSMMTDAFLGEYQQRIALDEEDRFFVPIFIAVRQVWMLALNVEAASRNGWASLDHHYFERNLGVIRRWVSMYGKSVGYPG